MGSGIGTKSLEIFVPPARLLVSAALFRAGMEPIGPSALLRLGLTRLLSLLFVFGLVWICTALVDLSMVHTRAWVERRDGRSSFAAFQLGSRVLKVIIVFAAITALIGSWGYNTGTIWAGLGVGGLALALAAQKTIENLFGGVSVITDRPVAIGDFCRFENRTGTVEDIGLRSTRLRTPERTLVTVPNAQFSAMTLENFSYRDKILFKTVLNLKRDATPEQLRKLIDDITQTLQGDKRIDAGNVPVRMINIGQWSFDVEVFVLIRTSDGDRFLGIQQELLLKLLTMVREDGMSLALPTQVSVNTEPTPAVDRPGAVAPS
jgi:MscS family membrane protein